MKQLIAVICLLMISTPVLAIEFDVWRTGMTLTEVVETARVNDITLTKTGMAVGNAQGFNKQFINEAFWKAPSVGYITRLLGVDSAVIMKIAQERPRRLYEIEIRMVGAMGNKQFNTELVNMLINKYGSPSKPLFSLKKTYQWDINDADQITLKFYSAPTLTYTDVPYKKYVEAQRGYKRQNEKHGYVKQDANKF